MLNHLASSCLSPLIDISTSLAAKIRGVAVDTRLLQEGDLFFALKGGKVDGHAYLEEAFRKGAIAAVVSENYQESSTLPLIKVKDPLLILQDWARQAIKLSQTRVVAVTGSVGKTTTKNFIFQLLKDKFQVAVSPGNSNSQIGLPLAILNSTSGNEEIIILEMGMTNSGEIANLISIAPPEVSIITSIGLVHACNFNGLEEIALSKAEILSSSSMRLAVLNGESPCFEVLTNQCKSKWVSYATANLQADYKAFQKENACHISEQDSEVLSLEELSFPGKHNVNNFLAAAAVARYFGLTWEEIADRAKTLSLPEKRLQIIKKNGALIIDDSYNAAPLSVKAALESMPEASSGGKKIALLGPMLELGGFSEHSHSEIGQYALNKVDVFLCFGNEWRIAKDSLDSTESKVRHFEQRECAVRYLKEAISPGDVILLKGSYGTGTWRIIEELDL